MAIAVNGGHVSRALDFYERENKYFIIGGHTPWKNDPTPDDPKVTDFHLVDVIGLKKVDNTYLVVPDNDNGTIVYRDNKWRVVLKEVDTTVSAVIASGSTRVNVASVEGLKVGDKIRVDNLYEGVIKGLAGTTITLDKAAPREVEVGRPVIGGAIVEGAKYVYIEGYLEYDHFPLQTYRQIGVCTRVVPASSSSVNILRAAAYSPTHHDEFGSLGVLEILDNRAPIPRDQSMRELISMVVEF